MPSKSKTKILGHQWRVDELWNSALVSIPERPLVKREHIWASELSGSYLDRYLRMNAHPYSTPPNDRSKRKFSAGHFFEWMLGMVLTCTGILKKRQLHGEVQLPGLLKVTGKLDFIAGGPVDWEKAKADVAQMQQLFAYSISDMPPIVMHSIGVIIAAMEKQYAKNPLEEMILEGKSVSSFMFEKLKKMQRPLDNQVLQAVHYTIPNKLPASLIYICKDDLLTQQFRVTPTKPLLRIYKEDVENMTGWIRAAGKNYLKNLPPKEPEIFFDEDMFRFSKNFKVEYSSYLEMNYGLKSPMAYSDKWKKTITAWNTTFKRCATGANMTPLNKERIKEASRIFPAWDKYVAKAKVSGVFDKEEKEDEE